jgi:ribonuclease D
MDFLWLDTADAARDALASLEGEWALDTEFVRERTFFPELALLQVTQRSGSPLLLDTAAAPVPPAIAPVVATASVIAHSASEDLQALKRGLGVIPTALFDTQIAAAFAGLGTGLGYQALLRLELGVDLPKGETRSDWMRRPLSDAQLAYAADDVRHLHALADRLRERLDQRQRLAWAEADMRRLRDQGSADSDPIHPHLEVRSAGFLDAGGQRRLCQLLRWRDREARARDLPRRWVLETDLALQLAKREHWTRPAFDQVCEAQPKPLRRLRDALWQQLNTPCDDDGQPFPLVRDPSPADRERLKQLQQAVAGVAAGLDLPDSLLCSRRHLESLLAQPGWPDALEGWRRPLLEPALRPLLG